MVVSSRLKLCLQPLTIAHGKEASAKCRTFSSPDKNALDLDAGVVYIPINNAPHDHGSEQSCAVDETMALGKSGKTQRQHFSGASGKDALHRAPRVPEHHHCRDLDSTI